MIESILNRKKSTVKTPIASLSIEILPEYGWSIGPNNERAFGPGTLFKGIKKVTVELIVLVICIIPNSFTMDFRCCDCYM